MGAVAATLDAAHFLSWCFPVLLCWNSTAGQFMKVWWCKYNNVINDTMDVSQPRLVFYKLCGRMSVFPPSERRLRTTRRRRRQHLLAGCGLLATAGLLVPFRLTQIQTDRPLNGRRLMDTGTRLRACFSPPLGCFLQAWPQPITCLHLTLSSAPFSPTPTLI